MVINSLVNLNTSQMVRNHDDSEDMIQLKDKSSIEISASSIQNSNGSCLHLVGKETNSILNATKVSTNETSTSIRGNGNLAQSGSLCVVGNGKTTVEPNNLPAQFEKLYQKKNIILKKKNKIRIGYYSADFRNHATSHLIAEMLEYHNKSKFEIFGFYLGRKINYEDLWHERIKKSFDEFLDVSSLTEDQISELSAEKEIDIAVDLMAHCNNGMENRFGAFVIGCAPIQVNFLGYPGTSGAKSIDYIIADKNLISDDNEKFYSEKIIFLPNSYQPNVKDTKISDKKITKEKCGLASEKFIFCCFNQHQKINPFIFDVWMRILKKNQNSLLWLLDDNIYSNKNLLYEGEKRGVDKSRIIFAKRLPLEDHLNRIKFGDLFLDTFPYSAHTTCSDALRVGLPVLTLKGNSFASRVAASLLSTIKLDDLISKNLDEYEAIANKIISDPHYFKKIKNKLNENILKTPLYNSKLFTKNLELGYEKIFENYKNNQPLKNFEI